MISINYAIFKEYLNTFVQFLLWIVCYTSYFHFHVFVWMISCFFVSYDTFLAMWLVSEFFRFSKAESVSTFFSPQLLLSSWYWRYCVIYLLAAIKAPSCGKSQLVANRLKKLLNFFRTFQCFHCLTSLLLKAIQLVIKINVKTSVM